MPAGENQSEVHPPRLPCGIGTAYLAGMAVGDPIRTTTRSHRAGEETRRQGANARLSRAANLRAYAALAVNLFFSVAPCLCVSPLGKHGILCRDGPSAAHSSIVPDRLVIWRMVARTAVRHGRQAFVSSGRFPGPMMHRAAAAGSAWCRPKAGCLSTVLVSAGLWR
jgi:hypothetical protein